MRLAQVVRDNILEEITEKIERLLALEGGWTLLARPLHASTTFVPFRPVSKEFSEHSRTFPCVFDESCHPSLRAINRARTIVCGGTAAEPPTVRVRVTVTR